MAGHDRLQHRLLGQLLGFQFHHQNRVRRAGDHEVESRVLHLLDRRVEDDLPLDDADARRSDRPHEGHAGKSERRGRGDHRQDVRVCLEVIGKHRRDDLGLAAEFVGKQRTDRPIDEARNQRLPVRRASLALQIAARNAARRKRLLLVVNGEGEKVLPRLGLLQRHDRRENGGLAPGGERRAVGLPRHASGFQHELAPAPVDFFAFYVKHLVFHPAVEDAKACGSAPRFKLVIGKTAGGWANQNASPRRSCHDARLSHVHAGDGPMPPPGRARARSLSGGCRGAR